MSAAPPQKLGKYEVRREVGRGGMGIVYEGFDPVIRRRVALKTFINEYFDESRPDNLLTRLRREAQAAGRLSHPNIIAVYDYGEEIVKDAAGAEKTTAFIAMEFIEGRSLQSHFEAQERFPIPEINRIMSELLDALEYSHSHGVVHRDIKPANIILLADGTVKVADFGVARIESSTLTQIGTVLGSPSYMSPEQFMGQTVDGRSDLYSAGVVWYQLLTAEVPFTGAFTTIMHRVLNDDAPPPSALNVQVPRAFDAVVRRAMAKRPDERFQSAAEFKRALARGIFDRSGRGLRHAATAAAAAAAAAAAQPTLLTSPASTGAGRGTMRGTASRCGVRRLGRTRGGRSRRLPALGRATPPGSPLPVAAAHRPSQLTPSRRSPRSRPPYRHRSPMGILRSSAHWGSSIPPSPITQRTPRRRNAWYRSMRADN